MPSTADRCGSTHCKHPRKRQTVTRTSQLHESESRPRRAFTGPVIDAPLRHPTAAVFGLGVLLAATTLALIHFGVGAGALRHGHMWMVPYLAVGFALAERFSFHLEFRREAVAFSLSEVPTAMALVFLDVRIALILRLLGSVTMMTSLRRRQFYKLFFNLSLYGCEIALAYVVLHLIAGSAEQNEIIVLFAVGVALVVASFTGMLIVSVALSMYEGGLAERIALELRSSGFVPPLSALISFACLAPALARPELALVTVIPIAAVWWLLQRYGTLAQQFRDLNALHRFSHAIGGTLVLDEIVEIALGRARMLLRADTGGLLVFSSDGAVIAASRHGPIDRWLPTERNDPAWAEVFDAASPVWLASGVGGPCVADGPAVGRALAMPVVDGGESLGLLIVADRSGVADAFFESDESSIESLASQLATSVRKAILHAGMEHAALHDALTGDYNRVAFERQVNDELVGSDCTGGAVLMLDLDKFKEVNDTLGHHVGDRVLVQFARRVRELLGPDDIFSRFGGDEFALFVRRAEISGFRALADEILTASYAPLHLDDLDVVVTTSIGIAAVTDDDRDAAAVLRRADIAMYSAKNEHAGFEFYREEIDRRTPERLSLLGDLRDAIELGDLDVHYQPKINLATEVVTGAEALVRWHHPTRGWVSPDDFIAVAEETGLIKRVTDQVLTKALQAARSWHAAGHLLRVAVNLSTHDLLDELLAERIARLLEQHGMAPSLLTLEITESSLLADTPRTMTTIERLRRLGVQLSLDDFGTGYSSLSYLRRLPVTELKVDRSFVSNLLLDKQDEVIVRSTIDLGHNLGLQVVAEGIESSPVLDRLADLGCDIGQGYCISRPLPFELFERWLTTTEYRIGEFPTPEASVAV